VPRHRESRKVKQLRRRKGSKVKVGYLNTAGDHTEAEMPMYELARIHEFGLGNAPARPHLRPTVDEGRRKYRLLSRKLAAQRLAGRISKRQADTVLGETAKQDVQERITDLDSPPNTKATIKRKGSSNPLIDTGELRSSVNWDTV